MFSKKNKAFCTQKALDDLKYSTSLFKNLGLIQMTSNSGDKAISQSDMVFSNNQSIKDYDQELWASFEKEAIRQEDHIELIASENYASKRILEAQGSLLTNKYAEGYPSKRYYGGCEYVDIAEDIAISRAKELFKADYANVQPHSGSSANAAAFLALLEPNDTILGMSLDHGGHLTHGAKVNFSGKNYKSVQYGLHPDTHEIDYDQVRSLAIEHSPKVIIAGFSAYSGIINWQKFREISDEVGAYFLVDMAHISGLVASGHYPSPVPYADVVTSTTHKTLRGPRSGIILAKSNELLEKKLNSAVFPGSQGGPLMHVIAAKAVCFKEALEPAFKDYMQQVVDNAKTMCETLISRGVDVVTGKTDNHIVLVDLRNKDITGKDLEIALGDVNITVNKNAVPNDPKSPFVTSGIRLGTPAVTTRGFKTEEIKLLSNWICDIIENIDDDKIKEVIKNKVINLTKQYPVYNL
jgi:glycine hydroxymethyltransferase